MLLLEIKPLYLGLAAGILTSLASLPQLIKLIKEKKADDVSITTFVVLLVGLALWVIYGIVKEDIPVMATNTFSFVLNALVVVFSIKYKRSPG